MEESAYFSTLRTILKVKMAIEEYKLRIRETCCLANYSEMTALQIKKMKVELEMEECNLRMLEARVKGFVPKVNPALEGVANA